MVRRMTILVTGAAGLLGEGLMRVLPRHGHEVRGLDIKSGPFVDIVGSVTDPDTVREAVDGEPWGVLAAPGNLVDELYGLVAGSAPAS